MTLDGLLCIDSADFRFSDRALSAAHGVSDPIAQLAAAVLRHQTNDFVGAARAIGEMRGGT